MFAGAYIKHIIFISINIFLFVWRTIMSVQPSGSSYIYIPETITVHLGPPDSPAENITIPFIDYVKNVASSELFPTWPEDALRANINAIVSIALNRIYTEWYPSRGYNFDITNSTQFDQSYVPNRGIFDNISKIVDETFDDYIVRGTRFEPLYAVFCDGRVSQCNGMYQWGSVDLANQGYTPIEILRYYYGEDIELIYNAPLGEIGLSYPETPLKLGDSGIPVYMAQLQLNNISINFPAIPKIFPVDGVFTPQTEAAVKSFQSIFNLPPTGIIDKGTWYKIKSIHAAVRKLAETTSRGLLLSELPRISNGIVVPRVQLVQYYLNILSSYYNTIPEVEITGVLDSATSQSLIEFQKTMNLPVTGIIDDATWFKINEVLLGILITLPPGQLAFPRIAFPGIVYRRGSEGPGVVVIQEYLAYISSVLPDVTYVPYELIDGVFGPITESAVITFQQKFGLEPNGIVDEYTWNVMVDVYRNLKFDEERLY